MDGLLSDAGTLLNVHPNEYDNSIRHNLVKKGLTEAFTQFPGRTFQNIPLAVKRRVDNESYVTWTGANTILGKWNDTFQLLTETRVTRVGWFTTKVEKPAAAGYPVEYALVRDLNTGSDILVVAKV